VRTAVGGAIHWMESPRFCGQVCHRPMEPQFTAWQGAPHAEVACTDCHVGEGARALVRAKLAGVRQLYHVATNQVPTPIPSVADMRPAAETCGRCHWSGRNSGEVVRIKRAYADDEGNSETLTILRMMVGGPGAPTGAGRAIHWHASPDGRIAFLATDAERQTIPYVRSTDKDGKVREYRVKGAADGPIAQESLRVMDCIDCHNTPAHRIVTTAEEAVDEAIAAGQVGRTLPFVRREAVRLVKAEYGTQDRGVEQIAEGLRTFYRTTSQTATDKGSGLDEKELARTIASIQTVYRRNVFPSMKVTFGVYPNNLGHTTSNGCFRCHDGEHVAADGATISADCEYCHTQVEPAGTR
jgi:hypothetical protein